MALVIKLHGDMYDASTWKGIPDKHVNVSENRNTDVKGTALYIRRKLGTAKGWEDVTKQFIAETLGVEMGNGKGTVGLACSVIQKNWELFEKWFNNKLNNREHYG